MMFSTSSTLISASGQHPEDVGQHAGTVAVPDHEHVARRAPGEPVDHVGHLAGGLERLHDPDHLVGDGHLGLVGGCADVVGPVDARHLRGSALLNSPVAAGRLALEDVEPGPELPVRRPPAASAASSTTEPREVLMRYAPGRIAAEELRVHQVLRVRGWPPR